MSERPRRTEPSPVVRFDKHSRTLPPPDWLEQRPKPLVGNTLYPPALGPDGQADLPPLTNPGMTTASWQRSTPSAPASAPPRPCPPNSPAAAQGASPAVPSPPQAASPMPQSDAPGGLPSTPPPAGGGGDTMVEQLVPRTDEEAAEAVARAVAEFANARAGQLQEARQPMVSLIELIARRVFNHQLTPEPKLLCALVEEGLSTLAHNDRVRVRVGTFFADAAESLRRQLGASGITCEVSVEPGLTPHGCVIESDLGCVDESLETRLERIFSELADPA